jgi:hypothetical protein
MTGRERVERPKRLKPGPKRTTHPIPAAEAPADVLEELAAIKGTIEYLERELRAAVAEARRRRKSWNEIAPALGITPQATKLRYGPGGALDIRSAD